jgi:hypothetical protein
MLFLTAISLLPAKVDPSLELTHVESDETDNDANWHADVTIARMRCGLVCVVISPDNVQPPIDFYHPDYAWKATCRTCNPAGPTQTKGPR